MTIPLQLPLSLSTHEEMKPQRRQWRRRMDGSLVSSAKKSVTLGELVRVHMCISEQIDSKIRNALLRIASASISTTTNSVNKSLKTVIQKKNQLSLGMLSLTHASKLMTDVFDNYFIKTVCSYLTLCVTVHFPPDYPFT
ncbi:hypothetical protein F2Q69_00015970 [Brassica cretica]|uniref:Uncharacterized protein n=1 Tax=Brassica cretica TaxID=69181 RepID=A0A8S9QXD2_BRACR|nr:hypothetical protein F2Q69_00015970 [Brassica cretica]